MVAAKGTKTHKGIHRRGLGKAHTAAFHDFLPSLWPIAMQGKSPKGCPSARRSHKNVCNAGLPAIEWWT